MTKEVKESLTSYEPRLIKRRSEYAEKKDHKNEVRRASYRKKKDNGKIKKEEDWTKRWADPEYRKRHQREYMREYRKLHPEKVLAWQLSSQEKRIAKYRASADQRERWAVQRRCLKYHMTEEEYYSKIKAQNNQCAICLTEFHGSPTINVDHNHLTGENRGMLCDPCNQAIGIFRDSKEIILRAFQYLEKYELLPNEAGLLLYMKDK